MKCFQVCVQHRYKFHFNTSVNKLFLFTLSKHFTFNHLNSDGKIVTVKITHSFWWVSDYSLRADIGVHVVLAMVIAKSTTNYFHATNDLAKDDDLWNKNDVTKMPPN